MVSPAHYAFAADHSITDAGSYQAAIAAANASGDAQDILSVGSGSQVDLTGHAANITTGDVILRGILDASGNRPVFDGQGLYNGVRATSTNATVALENLTFSNHKNYSGISGGATFVREFRGISNSQFTDNKTVRAGAAVSGTRFIGDMVDAAFSGNTVDSTGLTNEGAARGGAVRIQTFVGDIRDSTFADNRVVSNDETITQQGGAVYLINMTGDIVNTTFDNNRLEGAVSGTKMGGALRVSEKLTGNIENSVFTNNWAGISSDFSPSAQANRSIGGAASITELRGDIVESRFEGNGSSHAGGALHLQYHYGATTNDFGEIRDSDFIDNVAQWGGAVAYHSTEAVVRDAKARFVGNRFVGNKAISFASTFEGKYTTPPSGISDSRYVAAYGGAVYIQNNEGDFEFVNNTFVDNSAISARTVDNAGGYGGAIALIASKSDVHATISAINGGTTLFYGNRHNAGNASDTTGVANSIYFGNNNDKGQNRTASATFHVDEDSRLLMLDPMASQPDDFTMVDASGTPLTFPKLKSVVEKTGAGEWVLGGVNNMKGASEWKINEGSITLATVDYGGSQGEVQGAINLGHDDSSFTLEKDAVLAGNGTVTADTIVINGTIDPSTWKTSATPDQVATAVENAINDTTSTGGTPADVADAVNNVVSNVQDTTQSGDYGQIEIVSDDVTFGGDSKFIANINNDGDSDVLKVTGTGAGNATVTIEDGAKVVITSDEPITWEVGKDYAILDIDEDVKVVDGNGVEFADDNNAFDVELDLNQGQDAPTLLTPTVVITDEGVQLVMEKDEEAFKDVAQASGQAGMGDALLDLPDDHAVTTAIVNVKGGKEVVSRAFDNLSGEIHSSTHAVLLGNTNLRNVMGARLQGGRSGAFGLASAEPVLVASSGTAPVSAAMLNPSKNQMWANTWGFKGRVNATGNAAKVDSSGIGLAAGVDIGAGGVMLAFEDSRVKNGSSRNSRTDVNGYSVGGYTGTTLGDFTLRGGVAYSYLNIESQRNIWVPTLEGKLKADYKGHKVQAFVEGSRDIELDAATLSPYVGVTQVLLKTEDAREKATGNAAPAALIIKGKTDAVTLATVGVRASIVLPTATPVVAYGDFGYQRAFGDKAAKTTNRFADTNARFTAQGVSVGKNKALVGAGVQAQLSKNASVNVGYQGQYGSGNRDHAVNLQVKVRF